MAGLFFSLGIKRIFSALHVLLLSFLSTINNSGFVTCFLTLCPKPGAPFFTLLAKIECRNANDTADVVLREILSTLYIYGSH